uniref:DUF1754-domain-containing protein n=1 Tax=Polytomella parva TaxID=51329 RepID=A0A7S0YEE4_9CHLO|mmetsp:Transcript_21750/g.38851  ORF Transcript_21750/g.38851 Transcript_21750/m.38851 type:complete len:112 (+) Transcript_21750:236-571(+)|eukprot:CAMPEP_0175060876 /NCGR_PEP_ID=MMETSP0052_2-20121109/13273_1 /TAXON_ID=51329 ORGANISM="Polytomella parva, Strain SAG 63-3" /NCGR_SAMPLE_ID=MMETSP0052_2 /ASSEMBLY_ACC=CAM_ASM_000194 /LENGTH=111 /DNA_ID=CAMNT_0016326669 /DNA_START=180 /DNA_END=515 /DNA_ORIENTATION=+
MSFIGGKLKLKGGAELKVKGGIKKKKKEVEEEKPENKDINTSALKAYKLNPEDQKETMTDAERRREEKMKKFEDSRLKKFAEKSYREHVKEFNEHLSNLSEHHDIPKVGPG